MSGIGFGPAYGGGSNVISVAGRTGAVTLAVADVTGAASSAEMTDGWQTFQHAPVFFETGGAWSTSYVDPGSLRVRRTAAANAFKAAWQVPLVGRTTANKGEKPTVIRIKATISTADFGVDVAWALYTSVMPATGAALAAATSVTFTYDASHDTAAKRKAQGEHTITLTITSPVYLNADEHLWLVCTADATGTATAFLDIWLFEKSMSLTPLS